MNKTTLTGRLTRDVELRFTTSGKAICNFGIAVNEKRGEKETTTFLDCKAWAHTAEACQEHLRKGDAVILCGRLEVESWDDKATGQKRSKTVIVVDDIGKQLWKSKDGATQPRQAAPTQQATPDGDDQSPIQF